MTTSPTALGRYFKLLMLAAFAAGLTTPSAALAQGLLVNIHPEQQVRLPRPIIIIEPQPTPLPQPTYQVKELDVHVRLLEQVARVQVSQSFLNTGSIALEACFVFPLPYDGAIDRLTLMIDGKEFPAKLLPRDEARRLYESIVRKNRDPALLEWLGTGLFKTSVFPVPPGAERKVTLNYSQLCRKDHGLTDFVFPLSTAKYTSQPLTRLSVQVSIETKGDLKNVYSPTHPVEVQRDSHQATVTYKADNVVPVNDFRLFYDVESGKVGASVLSFRPRADDDGYFLLLASPEFAADQALPAPKTVIFVVDRSGSMSGAKIEQAKGALKFVLNNLREGDLFNVVAYDNAVEAFRPELQKFDAETRQAALGFVDGLYAGGSTNIDGALAAAMAQLVDSSRPNYVLFMTDGLPTAGEQNEGKIVANAKSANRVRARVVAFGVGYDVNSRLIDRLVRENFGQSEYVRPDENIEDRVSRLYAKIGSPVMTDVTVEFGVDAAAAPPVNRVYPRGTFDLFAGEQLVLLGRYKQSGAAKVTVRGSVQGNPQSFDFPADLVSESKDESLAFIEKLWAMRRIGEIIDELDLSGQNPELVKEMVELSTRHGILTPYTSYLADENASPNALTFNVEQSLSRLSLLEETEGRRGVAQRAFKGGLQKADRVSAPLGASTESKPARGGAVRENAVRLRDAETDEDIIVDSIRSVGAKAFYSRNRRWVDSTVTDEMEQDATKVEAFSDDYFKLADNFGRRLSQYLVFDELVLINLDGKAYLIEPGE